MPCNLWSVDKITSRIAESFGRLKSNGKDLKLIFQKCHESRSFLLQVEDGEEERISVKMICCEKSKCGGEHLQRAVWGTGRM